MTAAFSPASAKPRVWITRAEPGASRTAARLRDMGCEPLIQPLLAVEPLTPPLPDLDRFAALAFTSANGVAAFAALTPRRDRPVFAVGEATAGAAREAGFVAVRSADGDLTDLAGDLPLPETAVDAIQRYPLPEQLPADQRHSSLCFFTPTAQPPQCGTLRHFQEEPCTRAT